MNETLSPQQLAELSWGDAWFLGFRWLNDDSSDAAPSLLLHLALPRFPTLNLHCEWISRFVVDLDYANLSGGMPAWDVTFTKRESENWGIEVDLRPRGLISLDCGNFGLVPVA
ncbi:hypothetical protein LF1_46350 [Rubripirellula obstinata]|uniref:Uncharacterized protein n=1 Tax=Rubripirellula obstinata TaxID=406547 RepID=A0A5B1CS83_9BACT|nr:hypothetical protein [Rubripirellula obstinata]KAA1262074.1 hypothetical protein LF1_46350 [Rubripirellula obstinata]